MSDYLSSSEQSTSAPTSISEAKTSLTTFTFNSFVRGVLRHLLDSTAMNAVGTFIFGLFELFVLRMEPKVSLQARISIAIATYLGFGFFFAKGRDISLRIFKINLATSSPRVILLHDLLFLTAGNLIISPILYLSSGATFDTMLSATAMAIVLGFFVGPASGWGIDIFRELSGIQPFSRLPHVLRTLSPRLRPFLIIVLLVVEVAIFYVCYSTM